MTAHRRPATVVATALASAALVSGILSTSMPTPTQAAPAQAVSIHTNLAYGPDTPANLLDLYVPQTRSKRGLPLIVWTSGSAFGSNTVKDGAQAKAIADEFTQRGYAVALMNVHTNREAYAPTQGYDARAAVRYLREHADTYGIDPDAIVAMGNSSGAWSTAFAAVTSDERRLPGESGTRHTSSAVAASVLFFPPTEFLTMDSFATANNLPMPAPFYPHDAPGSPESVLVQCPGESAANELGIQECPATTELANPSTHVHGDEVPIWTLHGLQDDKLPYNQSQQLYEATTSEGNAARFTLVPSGEHVVDTIIGATDATTRTTDARGRERVSTGTGPTWDDIDAFLRSAAADARRTQPAARRSAGRRSVTGAGQTVRSVKTITLRPWETSR